MTTEEILFTKAQEAIDYLSITYYLCVDGTDINNEIEKEIRYCIKDERCSNVLSRHYNTGYLSNEEYNQAKSFFCLILIEYFKS